MEEHTAGDPMSARKWTRRTTGQIARELRRLRICISRRTVGRLLHDLKYSLRGNRKQLGADSGPDRNRQFLYINRERRRCGAWKTELQQQLCNRYGLTVTVAHYPTAASKWNPIEHRLFSEVSKHWAAEPLTTYGKILRFLRTTTTKTGLQVRAMFDHHAYPTKEEPTPHEIAAVALTPHKVLPTWNYTITPQSV